MTKNLTTALFPVAGIGRRLLPMTKAVPKELLPVGGLPLIQYAVNEAREAGIRKFVFVAGDNLPQLRDYFSPAPKLEQKLTAQKAFDSLELLRELVLDEAVFIQQPASLGLGHAIHCGAAEIDEPFAVLLPDDLLQGQGRGRAGSVLAQMKEQWLKLDGENNMIAIEKVPESETSRYGIMAVKQQEGCLIKASGVVEKPSANPPSQLALIGRYILNPNIFEFIDKTSAGAVGEIQITDAIEAARATTPLYGYLYQGKRFDCGTKEAYIKTQKSFSDENFNGEYDSL